jgi:NADH-quinone oxidoreductase subunit C
MTLSSGPGPGPGEEATEEGDVVPVEGEAALEASPLNHSSVDALRKEFPDWFLRHEVVAGDEHVVYIRASHIRQVLKWLKEEPEHAFNFLSDVTAVDYGGGRPLQVVYQLYSIPHRHSLRLKAELPLDELVIDSVVPLWETANWLEREVYDMFGITFRDHPDLRRILMPENYEEGYPLRKDFPLRGRFTRAEQTRRALAGAPEDDYTPEQLELGNPDHRRPQVVPWREMGGQPVPVDPPTGSAQDDSGPEGGSRTREGEV